MLLLCCILYLHVVAVLVCKVHQGSLSKGRILIRGVPLPFLTLNALPSLQVSPEFFVCVDDLTLQQTLLRVLIDLLSHTKHSEVTVCVKECVAKVTWRALGMRAGYIVVVCCCSVAHECCIGGW